MLLAQSHGNIPRLASTDCGDKASIALMIPGSPGIIGRRVFKFQVPQSRRRRAGRIRTSKSRTGVRPAFQCHVFER